MLFDVGILKSFDAGVPVVSIGNIVVGGTGKTPLTIEVGRLFLKKGKRVAVISRGYGRKSRGTVVVSDGFSLLSDTLTGGDETQFIARQLPKAIVIADEKRARGAKKAVEEFHAEVIVLDDGFQHRYLKRHIDIVLLDGTRSPMDTMLLPAGYRREPLSSLKRAHAVVITKVGDPSNAPLVMNDPNVVTVKNKFSSSYTPVAIRNIIGGVRQSLEMLKGHSVVAVSGIANPKNFEKDIEKSGAKIISSFAFDDHHQYTVELVRKIVETHRRKETDFIVTTEKDAVKLAELKNELSGVPIFALVMDIQMHQREQWENFLLTAV